MRDANLDHDIRCSNSCTRAGITALLLSSLAISLLQPLTEAKALDALRKYVTLRLALGDSLRQLDDDKCWGKLGRGQPEDQNIEEWTLFELKEHRCEFKLEPVKGQQPTSPPKSHGPSIRETISFEEKLGLKVFRGIVPIHAVYDSLGKLIDPAITTPARSYSYRSDQSIMRWQNLWSRLLVQRMDELRKHVEERVKKLKGPLYLSGPLDHLMLKDIRTIAKHEFDSIKQFELGLPEQKALTLPWMGIPLGLVSATTFIELGLLLSTAYFWLFYREARLLESFPAPGTLFGVFTRTRPVREMFLFLVMIPPIAATLLAGS